MGQQNSSLDDRLLQAVKENKVFTAKLLIKRGAKVGPDMLLSCLSAEMADLLYDHDGRHGPWGFTLDAIKRFIQRGVPIEHYNKLLSHSYEPAIIEFLLLQHSAVNPDVLFDQVRMLVVYDEIEYLHSLEYYLQKGVEVNALNQNGQTPLLYGLRLLRPNMGRTTNNSVALCREMVRLFCRFGADPSKTDQWRASAFTYLNEYGMTDLAMEVAYQKNREGEISL